MKIAALYDIHGNLPALEAVLADVSRAEADLILCGGDVFPGPMARECLLLLQAQRTPVQYIMGNGDREVLAARNGKMSDTIPAAFRDAMHWCAAQVSDEEAELIAEWPLKLSIDADGVGPVVFCHATTQNDTTIVTRLTPDRLLRPWVDALPSGTTVVCGHTHMQFDRTVRGVRIVNAGSVGMPYGTTRACWLLLDQSISLRQTEYDIETATRRVRATDYPQAVSFAAGSILQPPSEADMLAKFTPANG